MHQHPRYGSGAGHASYAQPPAAPDLPTIWTASLWHEKCKFQIHPDNFWDCPQNFFLEGSLRVDWRFWGLHYIFEGKSVDSQWGLYIKPRLDALYLQFSAVSRFQAVLVYQLQQPWDIRERGSVSSVTGFNRHIRACVYVCGDVLMWTSSPVSPCDLGV